MFHNFVMSRTRHVHYDSRSYFLTAKSILRYSVKQTR